MKRSVRLLSKYAVNDVLSMHQLKSSNLRMLKYLESNFQQLSSLLLAEGITVLNDLKPMKDPAALRAYLKYHFGDTVDLTDLREKHRSVYRAIDELDAPRKLVSEWGFTVRYRHIYTEEMLIARLRETAVNGVVSLDRSMLNRLAYRAGLEGISVSEYLTGLDLRLPATAPGIDRHEIVHLKDDQQRSFRQIADLLGISKSAAQKHYKWSKEKCVVTLKEN